MRLMRIAWTWLPLMFWMGVIFGLSQDQNSGALSRRLLVFLFGEAVLEPSILEPAQFVIRKAAHCTEFTVLTLLAWRALGASWRRAALFCVVAAGLDEWHQAFVPGRGPDVSDVAVDSLGPLLGYFVLRPYVVRTALLWETVFQGRETEPY